MASAAFAASSFLYARAAYVVWPLAKPILKIVIGLASNVAERILENIADIISEGGLFSKLQEFYTFGGISASLTMLRPILLVLVTMVLVIRFTLSRRPKNFRKWDAVMLYYIIGIKEFSVNLPSTNYLYNAATQERETTLKQLLIELDGFDTGKGVIFLGATNRMDLLDPALLRPGRFDCKIRIRPPGAKGRLDILKVHSSKVKMSPSVDLATYA